MERILRENFRSRHTDNLHGRVGKQSLTTIDIF